MPVAAGLHSAPTTGYNRRHKMASASGQPLPDYPVVANPGMENWTQGPGGQWRQKLPGGVTGVANIDYAPGYGPNQPGGWGNIGQPGFTPGGPDDPANGGTGYYNGGGMLNPPVQNPGMPMPEARERLLMVVHLGTSCVQRHRAHSKDLLRVPWAVSETSSSLEVWDAQRQPSKRVEAHGARMYPAD